MAQHEVRVALVMNGGVSLAVWMAGVTHELDLARRASTEGTPPAQSHDEAVATRWQKLLRGSENTRGRRLVIDVIAGTSAGGLNGALLATAIAHDTTLDPGPAPGADSGPWLREQWCSLGALRCGKLLPDPDRPNTAPTGSVLDGDFFFEQAKALLEQLTGGKEATGTHQVTLFTTASGLGRQEFIARDAADQPFSVGDHRFLYQFTNNLPPRYDPDTLGFTDPECPGGGFDDIERLALAARSSASFPVAFAPRNEGELLNAKPPRLRPTAGQGLTAAAPPPAAGSADGSGDGAWLMDGGVLDNAPFGPVLETVARGDVAGHVSRYVMYVVPSSGIGDAATRIDPQAGPPSWRTTAVSAIQYPREVDFRSDVEDLEALRVEADSAWSDSQRMFESARTSDAERDRLLAAARCVQPVFTRGRAAGGVWEALTVAQAGRLTVLDESASAPADNVADILAEQPLWTPQEGDVSEPLVVTTTTPDGQPLWPWGLGPAERVARTILRSVRHRTKDAFDAAQGVDTQAAQVLEHQLEVISKVRRDLRAVRTTVEEALTALGTPTGDQHARITAASDPVKVAVAINEVFADLRVQEALGRQIRVLETELPQGEELVETALAIEIVGRCMSSRTPDQRSAPFRFVRLGPDVGLPILDEDDQRAALALGDRILYGTQVGHFGAFGAEGWRRWDWLMGRLHAVAHLGRILHDTTTPGGAEAATEWVQETQLAVLAAENMDTTRLSEGVRWLTDTFPEGATVSGLGLMLQAMNEADEGRAKSTEQIGDRLVHVSGGLPAGLGRWVKAAAGRAEPADDSPYGALDRFVRWFAEPARTKAWGLLTGGRPTLEPSKGWPLPLLSPVPWAVAAVLGLTILGVLVALKGWILAIAAFVGAILFIVGLLSILAVGRIRRGRSALAARVGGGLGGRLSPHAHAGPGPRPAAPGPTHGGATATERR